MKSGTRAKKRDEYRNRIIDCFIELMLNGNLDTSHDVIAEKAGVGRRTVYRYFPDRDTLMSSAWERISMQIGPSIRFPVQESDLTDALSDIYQGFDKIADLAKLIATTPQGRAIRLSEKARRVQSYTTVTADAVKDLPPEDAKLATALLQSLHTTLWLELRDQWELDGRQMARACRWAITTLLADLRARGARPLDEPVNAKIAPADKPRSIRRETTSRRLDARRSIKRRQPSSP